MQAPISGGYVALPTPFRDGRLDLETLERLIDRVVDHGIDGILIAGTTGETPTLNEYERRSLIHAAVDFNHGRTALMIGVGTNCTRTSVENARFAVSCGADSILVVTPYYNRPNRRGLLQHYGQIADATDAPLVLYNVPKRTGCDLTPDVAAELAARHECIVAIKEASPSIERVRELVGRTDLAVLCGEDKLLYEFCEAGAVGAVSVVANLAPGQVTRLVELVAAEHDLEGGREIQRVLDPLIEALSLDVNPVPVKAALSILGLCGEEVRPPLAAIDSRELSLLRQAVESSPAIEELQTMGPG